MRTHFFAKKRFWLMASSCVLALTLCFISSNSAGGLVEKKSASNLKAKEKTKEAKEKKSASFEAKENLSASNFKSFEKTESKNIWKQSSAPRASKCPHVENACRNLWGGTDPCNCTGPTLASLGQGSGGEEEVGDHIPKILWAFWDKPLGMKTASDPEGRMADIVKTWDKSKQDGFEIRIIISFKEAVEKWLTPGVDVPDDLGKEDAADDLYFRGDLLRVALLYKYGGIWLDVNALARDSFKWLTDTFDQERKMHPQLDLLVFQSGWTKQAKAGYPLIENWFLAAPQGSNTIKRNLGHMLSAYGRRCDYMAALKASRNETELEKLLNGVPWDEDWGWTFGGKKISHMYMAQFIMFQEVLQDEYVEPEEVAARVHVLGPSDDTAMRLAMGAERQGKKVGHMLNSPASQQEVTDLMWHFNKLRTQDRHELLALNKIAPGSYLADVLHWESNLETTVPPTYSPLPGAAPSPRQNGKSQNI